MFANGNEVAKDEMKAFKWYLKSAEQSHACAQYNLGRMFANGNGVVKDEMKALE
jgi:uncharacterized protein